MSNWISGKELIAHWDIEDFELFDFMREGLQPYTRFGKKVFNTDSLEYGREQSVERCLTLVRGTAGTKFLLNRNGHYRPVTDKQLLQRAREFRIIQRGDGLYQCLPLEPINPPRHRMSFTLPDDNMKALEALLKLYLLRFKKDEASEFAKKHGLPRLDIAVEMPVAHKEKEEDLTSPSLSVPEVEPECEKFVRELRVYYENDFEVKIKEPRKKAKTFNHESLGFRGETEKGWTGFRDVIEGPDRFYRVGPSKTISYGRKTKILYKINNKLITYLLEKEYQLQVPEKFKIYERASKEGKGVYRFKFLVGNDAQKSRYDGYSKEKWCAKFDLLKKQHKETSEKGDEHEENSLMLKMKREVTDAFDAGLITRQEVEAMLQKDKIFDPLEIDENQRCEYDPDIHDIQ